MEDGGREGGDGHMFLKDMVLYNRVGLSIYLLNIKFKYKKKENKPTADCFNMLLQKRARIPLMLKAKKPPLP